MTAVRCIKPNPNDTQLQFAKAALLDDTLFSGGRCLDGLNRYVYCHNNPVRYVDPSGMDAYDFYEAMSQNQNQAAQAALGSRETHDRIMNTTDPGNATRIVNQTVETAGNSSDEQPNTEPTTSPTAGGNHPDPSNYVPNLQFPTRIQNASRKNFNVYPPPATDSHCNQYAWNGHLGAGQNPGNQDPNWVLPGKGYRALVIDQGLYPYDVPPENTYGDAFMCYPNAASSSGKPDPMHIVRYEYEGGDTYTMHWTAGKDEPIPVPLQITDRNPYGCAAIMFIPYGYLKSIELLK